MTNCARNFIVHSWLSNLKFKHYSGYRKQPMPSQYNKTGQDSACVHVFMHMCMHRFVCVNGTQMKWTKNNEHKFLIHLLHCYPSQPSVRVIIGQNTRTDSWWSSIVIYFIINILSYTCEYMSVLHLVLSLSLYTYIYIIGKDTQDCSKWYNTVKSRYIRFANKIQQAQVASSC